MLPPPLPPDLNRLTSSSPLSHVYALNNCRVIPPPPSTPLLPSSCIYSHVLPRRANAGAPRTSPPHIIALVSIASNPALNFGFNRCNNNVTLCLQRAAIAQLLIQEIQKLKALLEADPSSYDNWFARA